MGVHRLQNNDWDFFKTALLNLKLPELVLYCHPISFNTAFSI